MHTHDACRSRRTLRLCSGPLVALLLAAPLFATGGCSAAENAVNNAEGLASGCNELSGGPSSVQSLSIDGDTKAFVVATANLVALVDDGEKTVLGACIGIDHDLGVNDTWSAKAPKSGAAPDDEVTEACRQASLKIRAVLTEAQAQCSLFVSPAHCTVDEEAEVKCESACTSKESCQPGDITTLCTPAELTGECDGECKAHATCEGRADAETLCTGTCATDCDGQCDGAQIHQRHCAGMCEGMCDGDCTVADSAHVSCGSNVHCRGGCTVAYKAPECETTVTPPVCSVSQTCQASCKSTVETTSSCEPAGVSLECNGTVAADVDTVVATVKKNLPPLITLVQAKGQLAADAASQVVTTGKVVADSVTTLSGKAVACAGSAVTADANAAASLNVSVNASASVSGSAGGPS
ncbi:MAG: hypothetical protein ACRENE_10190 [Polyangiaceae bacterium]